MSKPSKRKLAKRKPSNRKLAKRIRILDARQMALARVSLGLHERCIEIERRLNQVQRRLNQTQRNDQSTAQAKISLLQHK